MDIKIKLNIGNSVFLPILFSIIYGLSTIPLSYGDVIYVSGEVEGTWVSGDTVIVENDIFIIADTSLLIEPNVVILFTGPHYFQVYGALIAENNLQEEHAIKFAGLDGRRWRGIRFLSDRQNNSTIIGCDIFDVWVAIYINGTSPTVLNNTIHALSKGIDCNNSISDIQDNYIVVGDENSSPDITGISLENESNVYIGGNTIIVSSAQYGRAIGIEVIESRPHIQDNWIDVKTSGEAYGIKASESTQLNLIRNIVRTISYFQMTGAHFSNSTNISLTNNTFHLIGSSNNISRGLMIEQGSRVTIIGNIFIGNQNSNGIESSDNSTVLPSSGYNDVWAHNNPFVGGWQGDSLTDINADPLIYNAVEDAERTNDYRLTWIIYGEDDEEKSPCIGTGSPRIGGPDMGAVPFEGEPENVSLGRINPESFKLLEVYPNPFNSSAQVNFLVDETRTFTLDVFNYQGRTVAQLWNGVLNSGAQSFSWSPVNMASGSYYIRLQSENLSHTVGLNYIR